MTAPRWLPLLLGVAFLLTAPALAQDNLPSDPDTVHHLLEKIEALEKRIEDLEKAPRPTGPPADGTAGKTERLLNVHGPLLDKLSIGGQIRTRAESRYIADYRLPGTFGRPAGAGVSHEDNADVVLERTRLHFDAEVNEHLRGFVEIQDSRRWGEEPSLVADTAGVDLKQGYLQIRNPNDMPLWIKAGRIEVPRLGDQRLISDLDWHNVGRSFDGMLFQYSPDEWKIHGWTSIFREGAAFGGDADDGDFVFNGLYFSYRGVEDHEIDFYTFNRYLSDEVFTAEESARLGDRWDVTPGARIKGKIDRFEYTAEMTGQFGDQAGDPIVAWAAVATAGYTFDHSWKPYVGLEYAFASGDDNPTDGEVGTFDPILPFGHFYHGHQDLIGWRNLQAVKFMSRMAPVEDFDALSKWTIHFDFHSFWLTEDQDSWYGANGAPIRRDVTGRSDNQIGFEIDFYSKWVLYDQLYFWAGYSHFFTGSFIESTGFNEDQDFVFIQAELKF